jgi:hypothetical protein
MAVTAESIGGLFDTAVSELAWFYLHRVLADAQQDARTNLPMESFETCRDMETLSTAVLNSNSLPGPEIESIAVTPAPFQIE